MTTVTIAKRSHPDEDGRWRWEVLSATPGQPTILMALCDSESIARRLAGNFCAHFGWQAGFDVTQGVRA